ncbi:MAG: hypothetical protein PHX51_08430 [Clostridia bacterium]|nr:hypothetical protein [Clostridia bacterium]
MSQNLNNTVTELPATPIFDQLAPEDQALALKMLSEIAAGNSSSYNQLLDVDYRERPVTPEEFISNPRYLGQIGERLYPSWKKDFLHIYNNPMIYHIILTGAIGIGKDFFTEVLLMMELYKIACLKDPHKFFDLAPNTDIVVSLVSVTKTQTKNVLFNQLKSMIDSSEWFCENFRRNKDKNDIIEFMSPADDGSGKLGKIRVMYGAPTNSSVIGENVITAVMDEANFMQVIEKSKKIRGLNKEFNQAQMVYDNLIRRMKSRYLSKGKLAGKIILLSSRQYPDDFVEVKIHELKDDPCVHISAYSLYEMKPQRYSQDKFFHVLVGNKQITSKILLDEAMLDTLNEMEKECTIEKVPEDFLNDFKTDLDGSIRDISGKPTLTVSSYVKQRDRVYLAIKIEVVNMLVGNIETTTFEDGDILDINKISECKTKHLPHAIHLDLSTSSKTENSTGFAMCHVSALKEVTHSVKMKDPLEGVKIVTVTEMLPVYRADIILQIRPPDNEELRLSLVRQLIHDLREYGFNIAIITADQYQSKDTLQIMEDNGFETAHLSVDTSFDPYDNLKFAIYEDRFEFDGNSIFINEFIHLEENEKTHKIDHRHGFSKDCSDAVAGACWSLSQRKLWDDGGLLVPTKGTMQADEKNPANKQESCENYEKEFTKNHLSANIDGSKKEEELTLEQIILSRRGA